MFGCIFATTVEVPINGSVAQPPKLAFTQDLTPYAL